MLTGCSRPRRGVALAELIVSMTLLGIIGSLAAAALRQQGQIRVRTATRLAAAMQLREALAPLAVDLAAVSPAAGDIPSGGARDSTLELRATIAAARVCAVDHAGGGGTGDGGGEVTGLTVVPFARSKLREVVPGDSVWVYVAQGTWAAAAVQGVTTSRTCEGSPAGERHLHLTLSPALSMAVPVGAPVRFTRRVRYSFYRASDGGTYLGLREWSYPSGGLAVVQPVAGPFDRRASRFSYLDSGGVEFPRGAAPAQQVAAVVVRVAAPPGRGGDTTRSPRAELLIALRNRR